LALARKVQRGQAARHKLESHGLDESAEARLRSQVNQGREAERRFVECNLRLVVYWAEHYQGRGLELLDLIQAGNLGLIRAVRRFDPDVGSRFSTYGSWWIRQAIRRAIANHGRTIRLPAHALGQIWRLAETQGRLVQRLGRQPTPRELALESDLLSTNEKASIRALMERDAPLPSHLREKLGEAAEEVRRILLTSKECVSLELTVDTDDDLMLHDCVEAEAPGPAQAVQERALQEALLSTLESLSDRERLVVEMRFGLRNGREHTLAAIGNCLGVTRERVRQIEHDALRKLRYPARPHALKPYLGSTEVADKSISSDTLLRSS
jgi:RNA polymerase primary sigma factor